MLGGRTRPGFANEMIPNHMDRRGRGRNKLEDGPVNYALETYPQTRERQTETWGTWSKGRERDSQS